MNCKVGVAFLPALASSGHSHPRYLTDQDAPKMPKKYFRDYIAAQPSHTSCLPLTHATDGAGLRMIRETSSLIPQPCPYFKESILYMFFGRPSYRPNLKEPASSLTSVFPVCFILNQFSEPRPSRVLPFDSGAYLNDLYEKFLHKTMDVLDFELIPNIVQASSLIKLFFGSDKAYFRAQPIAGIPLPPMEFELESYYGMIQDKQKNTYDDRISAIELQFSDPVELAPPNVLAVVLPSVFMDNAQMRDTVLGTWQAHPITYDIFRMQPSECTGQIFAKVCEFYDKEGMFG